MSIQQYIEAIREHQRSDEEHREKVRPPGVAPVYTRKGNAELHCTCGMIHTFDPYTGTYHSSEPEPEGEEITEEAPYDDRQDHDPCPDCNGDGRGRTPGWYQPFHGPAILCTTCDGAGWV